MQTREIKFRGWDAETKCMWIPIDLSAPKKNWNWLGEHDVPLMQFTGLKDKNGKDIYEGDIVRWSDGDYKSLSNPRIAEVRFDPELSFFAFNVGDHGHKFGFSNFIYTDTETHLQVIGNIYENPELVHVQEETTP